MTRGRPTRRRIPLRTRMSLLFGTLVCGVALFMIGFFPQRMAEQARISTELRAKTVTQVISTAVGPALEFDDADNAKRILGWLEKTPDAQFAVIVKSDGTQFAAWRPQHVPARLPSAPTTLDGSTLITSAPVIGRAGGAGRLYIGQSLARMIADREAARRTVLTASLVVLLIGLAACIVIATKLVRPFEKLTRIANEIARGTKPPKIVAVDEGPEVEQMTTALGTMLDRLAHANSQLVEASRHAGMAEVATGVLHNVGNILTSVNVGIESFAERVDAMPDERVRRTSELLADACAHGPPDPAKVTAAVKYLAAIAAHLRSERMSLLADLTLLRGHVDHVKRVISMQNTYARTGGVTEQVELQKLVDDALALACPDPKRHEIELVSRVTPDCILTIDRHRVLQILVNLLANAKDAVVAAPTRRISLDATVEDHTLAVTVADTGVGIPQDSLVRIFQAGFTTKRKGHGYGLHSSATAAEQLGGTLRCHSPAPGQGATFVLRVPLDRKVES